MSESYVSASSYEPASDQSGKVDAAKQEASGVKDTATEQAKNVAGTAKEEVKSVAGEAKSQVKSLYAQGQQQLKDQAGTQQKRVATGLRSASDQLDSMAASTDSGLATDAVRNVSKRLGSAASWLEDRDPQTLLSDVRDYARSRPAVFIGGALALGLVAGRLTRALAANAKEESETPDYSGTRFTGTDVTGSAGYAGTLPVDTADTSRSGVYGAGIAGAGGLAAGGLGDSSLGGADLDETGIDAIALDDSPVNAPNYDIPGGAANVTGDGLSNADTPLYAESVESFGGAGDDDRSNPV